MCVLLRRVTDILPDDPSPSSIGHGDKRDLSHPKLQVRRHSDSRRQNRCGLYGKRIAGHHAPEELERLYSSRGKMIVV